MPKLHWPEKRFLLSVLTLACVLLDVGFFLTVGMALKWLAEATSPILLAGLIALIILIARVGSSVRAAKLTAAQF